MKQSSMAVIGVIVVIVIVAIAALALSGQKNSSSSITTSNYTTAATTAASNAIKNTTGVVNSTTTVTNSSSNKPNSTVPSNSVNQSNTTKKYNLMVGSSPTIGNYLESSAGYTLYLLNSDTPYKTSTCTGTCATYWPPYMLSGNLSSLSVESGINASALGVINRTGGGAQLTYDGWPLYLFYKDTAPGQVNGNGVKAFGGTWYAITLPKPITS